MLTHEFGIVGNDSDLKNGFEYTPKKYKCICVDDNLIQSIFNELKLMKTYFHELSRKEFGLAYYGITIIPPESLSVFEEILLNAKKTKKYNDLDELLRLVKIGLENQKHIIHFGV
ncbi:short-chain dehydrogenase [Acidaminobacter sp. JC074]|uniref:hypothetical protein n=1 Tax=Acidaminobacter sp. JC074 TaxID=2530199 RepID=UPI001F0FF16E|nr:hypothetical protein [Acidaminobacter sp. JC074]MCH4890949.1 short-chain dehydrogenase [Acidaminobacter sp. JC074]